MIYNWLRLLVKKCDSNLKSEFFIGKRFRVSRPYMAFTCLNAVYSLHAIFDRGAT